MRNSLATARRRPLIHIMTLLSGFLICHWDAQAAEPQLLAHWKLAGDARDSSGNHLHLQAHGVEFTGTKGANEIASAARFDGRDDSLELSDTSALRLARDDFSITLRVHTEAELDDVLGDLVSCYDPGSRTGFQLSIQNLAGVTTSQPNHRHVHFGIDQGRLESAWADHGRVGKSVSVFALAVHEGELFASTCEPGPQERGHVYRFRGEATWEDLGGPDACNSVSALASYNGSLYAATSKYRLSGSSLTESDNPNLGGKIFRYLGSGKVEHVGALPEVEAIASLVVFRGKLFASSLYKPGGLFRYEGGSEWTPCGTPDGKRVEALAVYNGYLWATGYDEAAMYRYDGKTWEHMGKAGGGTQTYGLAVHAGELYVSQWPEAKVFRYGGDRNWIDVGRLGNELESMPLVVYNGKLYGGTLPSAEVYRFDGQDRWTKIGQLDPTPNVRYRRAWSMAVFGGRLYCGTLPSGHVYSIEAGKNVTHDRELSPGWHHVAAVRSADRLELYIDGQRVAQSATFDSDEFDLNTTQPLRIGLGSHDYFRGHMSDVRIYRGALSPAAIQAAAEF